MARYLFIDGASLEMTLKNYKDTLFDGQDVEINYQLISNGGCSKVFYYDCLPPRTKEESDDAYAARSAPKRRLFESLSRFPGWHVSQGIAKRGRKNAPEQKEVDILIAVDMLTHTHRGNIDHATFVASDLDFRPLIEAVVRDGLFLTLLYEPGHASEDLIQAADERLPIDAYRLQNWFTDGMRERWGIVSAEGVASLPIGEAVQTWESGVFTVYMYEDRINRRFQIFRPHPLAKYLQLSHKDSTYLKRFHDVQYRRTDELGFLSSVQ